MADLVSITLTDKAAEKVREFFERSGAREPVLRISLVRTHCMGGRGYAYRLAPESAVSTEDISEDAHGVKLVVSRGEASRLAGTVIDYVEDFQESGFSIQNPQSLGKCHCGHHDILD